MAVEAEVVAALIGLAGVPLTGAVTLVAVWFGGKQNRIQAAETAKAVAELEREKYAHDRLWDARRELYSKLVAQMRALEKAADIVVDGFTDGGMGQEEYFAQGGYDEDHEAAVAAHRMFLQTYDDGRLMVSEAFASRVERYLRAITEVDDEDPPTRAFGVAKAAGSAHKELLAIALGEIAPQV